MTVQPKALSWRQAIEPWYLSYALLSATTTGVVPIVLPLEIVNHGGSAMDVGRVTSAMSLGMLTAPLWGNLADRYRVHRLLCVSGAFVILLVMLGFAFVERVLAWYGLSLLLGAGIAASFTVGNLFIIERNPQEQWNDRIGWFQTFATGGTVVGLVIAGALSHLPLDVGLVTGAATAGLAIVLGGLLTRTPSAGAAAVKPRVRAHPRPTRHVDWALANLLGPLQNPNWASFRRLFRHLSVGLTAPFGLFLALWLLSMLGMSAVNALYPLLMREVYGVEPGPSSFALAIATALGLTLYSPTSLLIARFGPARVLRGALGIRLICLILLTVTGFELFTQIEGDDWVAMIAFGGVTLVWPVLSVVSTVLTSQLVPGGAGEGMGIYNASTAAAGLSGPILGAWTAHLLGYDSVWAFGAAGVGAAFCLSVLIHVTPPRRTVGASTATGS